MIPKTTKVFGRIHTQSGLPATRARGFATLNRYEVDNGFVVPHTIKIACDADGYFETDFWPNSRGSGGSSYTLELDYQGEQVFSETFVVPEMDTPVDILDILLLQPYPPISQAEQILRDTQAALVQVKADADLTQANADKVAIDKETALQAAALATEEADRAGNSAAEAEQFKDAAEDIKTDILTKFAEAEALAEDAQDYAKASEDYSLAALDSKNEAKISEDNSKASELLAKQYADEAKDTEASVQNIADTVNTQAAQVNADSLVSSSMAELAEAWATKTAGPVENSEYSAKYYANQAKTERDLAEGYANSASSDADYINTRIVEAETAASNAKTSETNAIDSKLAAKQSEDNAKESELAAKISEENALQSANQFAENFAQMATAIINTQTIVVEHHGFGD